MKYAHFVHKIFENLKVSFSPLSFFNYSKKLHNHHILSYSQEGEDRVIARYLEAKNDGFYVDIGAHHPQRFSNTYYFYLQGWRGINVDAMPGCMEAFNKIRPRDINVEAAVSDVEEELTYYEFNERALNGFSQELAEERDGLREYKIVATHSITTRRVGEILDELLPLNQEIDFLSVDVEGLDLQVLKSNNWDKYRPRLIIAESLTTESMNDLSHSDISIYMNSKGYRLCSKLFYSTIFLRVDN